MKAWVAFIDGTCFFFETEEEAKAFRSSEIEAGAEVSWPPELLEANTDTEFRGILNYVCEGLQ